MVSLDLAAIGFFQFDNLVVTRVPFLLLHEDVVFAELFGSVERMALERWAITVNFDHPAESVYPALAERKIPKDMPVVLLTKTGHHSQKWLTDLEATGFKNVYWIPGGWEQMKADSIGG